MNRIPYVPRVLFIEFQLMHYEQRVAEAKTERERLFLKKELYNIHQAYLTYYN